MATMDIIQYAGGSPANDIAKWDGSAWSALGSGVNNGVSALAVFGSHLYVGGGFITAGGKFSPYAAAVNLIPNNLDLLLPSRGGWRAILGQ